MLKINGLTMPEPKQLSVSLEKIWSSNTGRSANGTMVGDLIGTKYKLEIQWAALTAAQAASINAAVKGAFFSVTFIDPATGKEKTITCYAGTPKFPVYSYVVKRIAYYEVSVNLIEQ